MTIRSADENDAAAETPAETVTALAPDALEAAAGAASDPAAPLRPMPAFRRFAAAHAAAAEPDAEAPTTPPDRSPDSASVDADPAPTRAPPADRPPILPLVTASPVQPPSPPLGPVPSPPPPPPVAEEPDADRVAAALRRLEETDAFRPAPPRDEQADLDASVGCGEWFDRRPVQRPAPPPAARAAPAFVPAAPPPAAPPANAEPALLRPATPRGAPETLTAPPTEFGGGDIGAGSDRLAALLIYLLLIVGPPTVGLGLAAAWLLARRLASAAEGDWLGAHYRYQFRTASVGLAAGAAGVLLLLVDYVDVLAALFLVLLVGWIVLRAALGLHYLFQGRPHPNYRTWLV